MTTRDVRLLLVTALVAYGPLILIWSLCIFGVAWIIAGVEVFILVPAAASLVALAGLLAAPFKRLRQQAIRAMVIGGALVLLFVPTMVVAGKLRMLGFELAAQRATPLVAAIKAYEKDNGAPPATLQELLPRYLPQLPKRIPPLELITGEAARSEYQGNAWVLVAQVSTGLINWDLFMYFPNQQYPELGYGGAIERVADWAYVHE